MRFDRVCVCHGCVASTSGLAAAEAAIDAALGPPAANSAIFVAEAMRLRRRVEVGLAAALFSSNETRRTILDLETE